MFKIFINPYFITNFYSFLIIAHCSFVFQDILECEVYTCMEECDKAVAEYAKKYGAMGILGQDSDYVIYNTAHYYFSINHLNLETLDTIMYDRNALSRHLHLSVDQLPVLSCLIGKIFGLLIKDTLYKPTEVLI